MFFCCSSTKTPTNSTFFIRFVRITIVHFLFRRVHEHQHQLSRLKTVNDVARTSKRSRWAFKKRAGRSPLSL